MQKLHLTILIVIVIIVTVTSCQFKPKVINRKPLIVTTVHPYELIVRELVDTLFTVELLNPSYDSTQIGTTDSQDILKLEKADVIISNGLGLETNLGKVLLQSSSKTIVASSFVDKKLLLTDNNTHSCYQDIWNSPEFLTTIIIGLSNSLGKRYPMSKDVIESNARLMIMEINQVDGKIKMELEQYHQPAVVILDSSFAIFLTYFRIDYVNIIRPDAGNDITPQQMQDLIIKVKTKKIKAVLTNKQINSIQTASLPSKLNLKIITYENQDTNTRATTIADYLWLSWIEIKAGLNKSVEK